MRPLPLLVLSLCVCRLTFAGVVRIEVTERSDVLIPAGGAAAGPYERVVGKVHFAIDPKLAANRIISDIEYAPRNARGLVEFSADLYMFQPKDPARGNGTVLFQVSNRGRKDLLMLFNRGAASNDPRTPEEMGDGFLFDRGFTLAWIGWQFDIPDQPPLLRISVAELLLPPGSRPRSRISQVGQLLNAWRSPDAVSAQPTTVLSSASDLAALTDPPSVPRSMTLKFCADTAPAKKILHSNIISTGKFSRQTALISRPRRLNLLPS